MKYLAIKLLIVASCLFVLAIYMTLVYTLPVFANFLIGLSIATGVIGTFLYLFEAVLVLIGFALIVVLIDWWW
ncbi:hypothetical protein H9L19_06330 [Weissella diestrammenae]|uniref:Uncharacterized protein n=1 Tax=Weissella diestrammenae TaxID=1162633 RepID=A0A7G9T4H4_9LACO|nr:hypothetical protein [Weissella diestrammenae]MCM0582133.1 hypothetical protein [Weissella diestrammenae]QNN74999.1 hypothetical protein H9L19_06330 [Weissella diestrammenae]